MSLAWAAPAVLALGALLLGPVLAHLTRQAIRDRRPFGALLLLQRLQRRLQRQRRISDRLLLLLRLLALACVVLAASRPELRWPDVSSRLGASGRVVVILDTSLSMDQRVEGDPALALARRAAAEEVRGFGSGVQVALITAGGAAALQTADFTEDLQLVAALIEGEAQTAAGTDMSGAFLLARTLLKARSGEVVVYTDESGPGIIEGCVQDLERLTANGAVVIPRVYAPGVARNVVPVEATYGDGIEGGTVAVRIANYGPDAREVPTSVFLPDGTRMTSFVALPGATEGGPGVEAVRFTVPRQAAGGVARVEVDDPDLPLDNVRYFHLPHVGASRVLLVDGDPGSSPTRSEVYFLERALAPWGLGGLTVDVVSPAGVAGLDPTRHRVVYLANVADPGPLAPHLTEFVRAGGGLVIGMGENVTAERYNLALSSLLPAPLRKVRDLVDTAAPPMVGPGSLGTAEPVSEGVPLELPDVLGLELFRPFGRGGRDGFGVVRSRRIMTVEPYAETDEVQTLLRYVGGAPALVEREIGLGRVLLWTGTLDLGWGNFPLQAVYPAFLQRLTSWLGGEVHGGGAVTDATVGNPVELGLPPAAADVALTGPGGRIEASERGIHQIRFTPMLPGAYAAAAGEDPPVATVAVNTPLPESDVRHTTSWMVAETRVAPEQTTARRELWGYTLGVGGLAFLVAAILASLRRSTPVEAGAPVGEEEAA